MDFAEENSGVPTVPYSPQPSQLPSPMPTKEPNYASIFGQAGVPQMGAAPEPSFGDMFSQGAPQEEAPPREPAVAGMGPRNILAEINASKKDVTRAIQDLASSGSRVDRAMAAKMSAKQEDDDLAAQLKARLDAADSAGADSDPNAGYADPKAGIIDRAKQSLDAHWTRFKAGAALTDEGALSVWKKKYGDENVKVKDKAIWFRRQKGEKFRKVDPETFELVGDTLLDGSGPIIEGAVSVALEAAGIMPLAAATWASGGSAAPVTIPAAAGVMAGAGAAGVAARDQVAKWMGVEEATNLRNEMALSAGLNVAVPALGWVAKKGFSKLGTAISNVMESLPENRKKLLAEVRVDFDDWVNSISTGAKDTLKTAGNKIGTAVESVKKSLDDKVSLVYDKVEDLASERGLDHAPVENTLQTLKSVLEDNFIKFAPADKGGWAVRPGDEVAEGLATAGRGEMEAALDMFGGKAVAEEQGQAVNAAMAESGRAQAAFGSLRGGPTADKLIQMYNSLLGAQKSRGGIPREQLYKTLDGVRAELDKFKDIVRTEGEERDLIRVASALSGDRDNFFKQALEGSGTSEEKLWRQHFDEYSGKIEDVLQFNTLFAKKESAEQFAKALVQPNNSERIKNLKSVLVDPKQWDNFRGAWLNTFLDGVTDPNSGVLLTAQILPALKHLGKETVDELMTVPEQAALRKLVAKGNKIAFRDLLDQETKAGVMDLLPLLPVQQYMPARIGGIWKLFQGKKETTDFLINEGLIQKAKMAKTKVERNAWLETRDFLADMVKDMPVVKKVLTDPKTGKRVKFDAYLPTAVKDVAGAVADNQGTIGRKGLVQGAIEGSRTGQLPQGEFQYAPPADESTQTSVDGN